MEKWKTETRFPTFPRGARDDYESPVLQNLKSKKGSRPLRGLLIPILFRIIMYWNRILVSGSFFDWKMLAVRTCACWTVIRPWRRWAALIPALTGGAGETGLSSRASCFSPVREDGFHRLKACTMLLTTEIFACRHDLSQAKACATILPNRTAVVCLRRSRAVPPSWPTQLHQMWKLRAPSVRTVEPFFWGPTAPVG
jgi:hypothetical protein